MPQPCVAYLLVPFGNAWLQQVSVNMERSREQEEVCGLRLECWLPDATLTQQNLHQGEHTRVFVDVGGFCSKCIVVSAFT